MQFWSIFPFTVATRFGVTLFLILPTPKQVRLHGAVSPDKNTQPSPTSLAKRTPGQGAQGKAKCLVSARCLSRTPYQIHSAAVRPGENFPHLLNGTLRVPVPKGLAPCHTPKASWGPYRTKMRTLGHGNQHYSAGILYSKKATQNFCWGDPRTCHRTSRHLAVDVGLIKWQFLDCAEFLSKM